MIAALPGPPLIERFRCDVLALTGPAPGELGVAVSGGADSLALLLLAHAAFREVRAISIDHGLRDEAGAECRFVGEVCAMLGVPHDVAAVTVAPAGDGLQAAARVARLAAYRGWAERHGVTWLLTGHHADDQAETLLMRLARGAGVTGLSGIPPKSRLGGEPGPPLHLLRPLLRWSREELAAIVDVAGVTPVSDPSNADRRFDRTRFRDLLARTDLLDPHRLAAVADHCRDADDAVEWIVRDLRGRHIVRESGDRIRLILADWPREVLRRLVLESFAAMAAYPRGPETMRLIGLLQTGRSATLAGIKAVPKDREWTFTRAPPRRAN